MARARPLHLEDAHGSPSPEATDVALDSFSVFPRRRLPPEVPVTRPRPAGTPLGPRHDRLPPRLSEPTGRGRAGRAAMLLAVPSLCLIAVAAWALGPSGLRPLSVTTAPASLAAPAGPELGVAQAELERPRVFAAQEQARAQRVQQEAETARLEIERLQRAPPPEPSPPPAPPDLPERLVARAVPSEVTTFLPPPPAPEAPPPAAAAVRPPTPAPEAPPPAATVRPPPPAPEAPLPAAATVRPPPPAIEAPPQVASAAPPSAVSEPSAAAPAPPSQSRVFLHHNRASQDARRRAATLSEALADAGIAVIAVRPVATGISRTTVRYFSSDQLDAAARLDRMVRALDPPSGRGRAGEPQDFSHYRPLPQRGTIEVWLAG